MARTRTLANMRSDAYKRSDNEGTDASDGRHPTADVTRYVNQGCAELWDLLIEARGPEYYRVSPSYSITTTADTDSYTLPAAFYMLISVRLSGDMGAPLVPFTAQDEPVLRHTDRQGGLPTHYQLQRTNATSSQNKLVVLPEHDANLTLVVDYVPSFTDLSADGDLFDGLNGWEEYAVLFAARCMAVKDEEWELVRALDSDMDRMRQRIMRLAPKRDMHRARRVKDVRGPVAMAKRWW